MKVDFALDSVRVTSLEKSASLMESADETIALISQKLNVIVREPVEVSSFTLADPSLLPGLKVNLCFLSYENENVQTFVLFLDVSLRSWTTGCSVE